MCCHILFKHKLSAVYTVCGTDCGLSWSEKRIMANTNTHCKTQMNASKWALALNFWMIINLSSSDKVKEKKKIAVQFLCLWRSWFLAHTAELRKINAENRCGNIALSRSMHEVRFNQYENSFVMIWKKCCIFFVKTKNSWSRTFHLLLWKLNSPFWSKSLDRIS